MNKKRWMKFLGVVGFVSLFVGVIGYVLIGEALSNSFFIAHIAFGILTILIWFFGEGSKALGSREGVISGRSLKFGSGALVYTTLFIVILVSVNYIIKRRDKRWDLTLDSAFSLAEQSESVLKDLKEPLKLVGFVSPITNGDELGERLKLYKQERPDLVDFEIIDPQSQPHLVEKYAMKSGNLVYIEYGKDKNSQISRINGVTEEEITNAIVKLTRGAAKKIYFVTGHGELSIDENTAEGIGGFAQALANEHLTTDKLTLASTTKIPEDAASLIIASPSKNLTQPEIDTLKKYVDEGGSVLLFSDPRKSESLDKLTSAYGITINEDVVVDTVQRLFAGPALGLQPLVNSYGVHQITRNLRAGQDVTIFNIASSLKIPEQGQQKDFSVAKILETGNASWGETNLAAIFDSSEPTATLEDGQDTKGPVTIGAAYEKKLTNGDKVSKLVVYGDSDWITNGLIDQGFNRDLALNSVNWLAGQESAISIRPRSLKESLAPMTRDTFRGILAYSILIPELILLAGLLVWWQRKEFTLTKA
jgi:ABC-type uncharacterized transport system involved in gliding motility auxiliary subunit